MCSVLGYCGSGGSYEDISSALRRTRSRGPDAARIVNTGNGYLGFNRLSIMGLTEEGMQPFAFAGMRTLRFDGDTDAPEQRKMPGESELMLVCNGEIYGFRPMKEELQAKGYSFISDSDCEILPAL